MLGFKEWWHSFRSIRTETLLLQMYSLKVALAFGLASVILVGGEARFSGPSFKAPRDLVEWTGIDAQYLWGGMFLVLGIALIVTIGHKMAVHVLRFGLVVYFFLVIAFLSSVIQVPTASLTGVVAYGVFGVAHLILSVHLDKHGWR